MAKSRSDTISKSAKKRGASGCGSARSIENRITRLCGAKPDAFLIGLFSAVQALVSFVNAECKRKPEKSEKLFALLARSISRIYTRIDSGGDIVDCVLKRQLIPNEDKDLYSYRSATAKLQSIRKQCLELTVKRAMTLLPEKFRECTWCFCDACEKNRLNRWELLCIYNDLIADVWGCAKALAGSEDVGESAA